MRSLRRQVGLVTQDTILFDDTVYANIAYADRRASAAAVEAAARQAFAHEFIEKLPEAVEKKARSYGFHQAEEKSA